jgi:hypothetical protein
VEQIEKLLIRLREKRGVIIIVNRRGRRGGDEMRWEMMRRGRGIMGFLLGRRQEEKL